MTAEHVLSIKAGGGSERIHALEDGDGSHVSIVWHGLDSVNRFYHWSYCLKYGKLVRAGLPGHGPVPQITWRGCRKWTATHLIDIGVDVAQRYFRGEPLTLIGHSTGALIALGTAIRAPYLVGQLILMNPLIWSPFGRFVQLVARTSLWRWIAAGVLAPTIRKKRKSVDSFLEGLKPILGDVNSFYENPNTIGYTRIGHGDYTRTSLSAVLSIARICATVNERHAIEKAKLQVPALILHGENDTLSPVQQSEWLAKRLANGSLIRMQGVGHLCYAEREHECAELISKFMDAQIGSRKQRCGS